MQVAICDDEQEFRKELRTFLVEYKRINHIQIDIYEFESGESLLSCEQKFDVVFIDYQMSGINGLETAGKLRMKNSICCIIFVTAFPEFVFDSFEVQPFRFLVKPLDKDKVAAALDCYIRQQKSLNPITVIEDREQKTIPAEDILYLEADGKHSLIRTADHIYSSSRTLSKIIELLPEHCFYRVHKSYIVNLYCIESVSGNEIIMINGEKAQISRSRVAQFKKRYMQFVKDYYVKV